MVLSAFFQSSIFQNGYVAAISILVFFFLLAYTSIFLLRFFVKKVAEHTTQKQENVIIARTYRPLFFIILLFGCKVALTQISLSERIYTNAHHILNTTFIVLVFYILYTVTHFFLDAWGKRFAQRTRSTVDEDILPLFHKAVKVAILLFGALFVLGEWGVDVTGLLAGVGIAGLVLGLALKDSLANIFGGISLIMDKAFRVGDVIKTSDGDMGIVQDIGLRSTRIKTWDNELLVIPNGQLANAKLQNFKQPDETTRAVIKFGVTYGTSISAVKKIVENTLGELSNVLKEGKKRPKVYFTGFGESSLNLQATFWVPEYMKKFGTKEKAMCAIYDALNKKKIAFAFPTRTLYVHGSGKEGKKYGTNTRTARNS